MRKENLYQSPGAHTFFVPIDEGFKVSSVTDKSFYNYLAMYICIYLFIYIVIYRNINDLIAVLFCLFVCDVLFYSKQHVAV